MSRRKKQAESAGNHERWLITYADMITLLLVLFIVLFTLSQIDVKKFQYLSASLNKAMGAGGMMLDAPGPSVVQGLAGKTPRDQMVGDQAKLNNVKQQLEKMVQQAGLSAKIRVSQEERGVVLSFQEQVLFRLGEAELTPSARALLKQIAPILQQTPNYLRVEGHTDNLPIHTARFPSNWELSAARATNVLRELSEVYGISPQRLSALAFGEYRPVLPNTSEANRQQNRRVDIVILSSKFSETEPGYKLKNISGNGEGRSSPGDTSER